VGFEGHYGFVVGRFVVMGNVGNNVGVSLRILWMELPIWGVRGNVQSISRFSLWIFLD